MNYLAHAWLSFYKPEILVGNMISDFIKGKQRFDFAPGIQQGIMLHREIDSFTDAHEATKKARQFFKPVVGLYAGAFVDVAYDYFLANDTNEFPNESLQQFSVFVYEVLDLRINDLPPKFAQMFFYMKRDNWLYNYKTLAGTAKSLQSLTKRAKYLENDADVFACFENNMMQLRACYEDFFPAVKAFAINRLA